MSEKLNDDLMTWIDDKWVNYLVWNDEFLVFPFSAEFKIIADSLINASLKPSSITSFLLKSNLNGLDISMLLISKAFPYAFVVEKKNKFRDRNIKKIYKVFKYKFLYLISILYNNE